MSTSLAFERPDCNACSPPVTLPVLHCRGGDARRRRVYVRKSVPSAPTSLMDVSQEDDRRFGRAANTANLGLVALVSAVLMLAPPRAIAQCTNIASTWNYSEAGTVTLALTASDGESSTQTDPVSGSGNVTITQTSSCTFQYIPIPLNGSSILNGNLTPSQLASLARTVTVNGDNLEVMGIFVVINTAAAAQNGLTITSVSPNVYSATGQVTASANPDGTESTVITLYGTGDVVVTGSASNNGQTVSFTLTITASTTATLVANGPLPLQVITTSVPSVATGQAYRTTLAAIGGSGNGYTWSRASGALPSGFTLSPLGVLSSSGSPAATANSYDFTVQVTDSAGNVSPPQPLTLVILCPVTVTLTLGGTSADGLPSQTVATFVPENNSTLLDYATACGFTKFDWAQTTILNPGGIFAQDDPSKPLKAPPPFLDPPPSGYTFDFTCTSLSPRYPPDCDPKGLRNQWLSIHQPNFASANPFYYSPSDIATGCAEGYEPQNGQLTPGCQLLIETDAYTLNFYDAPSNSSCQPPVPCFALKTQLVGLCDVASTACNLPGPSAALIEWTWLTNFNGTTGGIYQVGSNFFPPDPGSGTGGITITSINGVPVPTVTVTPSSSSVTTEQTLSVMVVVGDGIGSRTPTGSIILTSGNYTSAATTLSSGGATVSVPAGSLAIGTDTLTASYTPDTASASAYTKASGSASVTVTAPAKTTPTVMVTPSSSSITTAQGLTVTVTVRGGSGNPTPTGTVTLTSGSYTSGATTLSGGSAAITIPAGSLATGTDTLTASYPGDSNYVSAIGATSVTVTAPSALRLSAPSLTFGNQPMGTTSAAQTETVTNTGATSLTFMSIAVTGDFAIATSGTTCSTSAALAAGGSCAINVTFSPTATGTRSGNLTLTYNAVGSPQTVSLSGTGTPSATGITWTLNATLSDGAAVTGYFAFDPAKGPNQNITNFNINVSAATPGILSEPGDRNLPTSVFFPFDFTPANSSAGGPRPTNGGSFVFASNATFANPISGLPAESLFLSFVPVSPLSSTSSTIINNNTINVSNPYSNECFNCDPYVTFAEPTAVSFSPSGVAFGNQNVGTTSASQAVNLSNTGTVALAITSIATSANFAETNTCGSGLATGGSCAINVTFSPPTGGGGPFTGTLTVTDNSNGVAGSTQTVSLTGTGTATVAGVSPPGLAFGNHYVWTTSGSQAATLSNTGTAALAITGITTSGDFAQTNTCTNPVAPGANCSVSVTFVPQAPGPRKGVILISDNAAGNPHTIIVTGVGMAANPSPASLTFASQSVGTSSAPQMVTLSNSSGVTMNVWQIAITGANASDFSKTTNCGSTLAAGTNCTINVTFTPSAAGARSASLLVSNDGGGGPQAVALSGTGGMAAAAPRSHRGTPRARRRQPIAPAELR